MKKLLILTLFLTSSFFENKNAYGLEAAAAAKNGAQLDVPAAQPPAKLPAPPALLAWLQDAIRQGAAEERAFLQIISILYKNLDISAEFSEAVGSALTHFSSKVRIEGIWALKPHVLSLNPELYTLLVQTAVQDKNADVRMEAVFALDQPDIILNNELKLLLLPALEDKNVYLRAKAYQILAAKKNGLQHTKKVEAALTKALLQESYLKDNITSILFARSKRQLSDMSFLFDSISYKTAGWNAHPVGLSIILGKFLHYAQHLHPEMLLETVQLIKDLRLVNKETFAPLMQLLVKTKNRGLRKEIIQAAVLSRPGWEPLIFESVVKVLFNLDTHTQNKAYDLLDQQLWQHPDLQKNIQTIFKGRREDFYLSKNGLFSPLFSPRPTPALWALSRIHEPINSEVQRYIELFLSGSAAAFRQLMALELTLDIPDLWQDAGIRRGWLKMAQKGSLAEVRATAVHILHIQKGITNQNAVRNFLDILALDYLPKHFLIQKHVILKLEKANWRLQPPEGRKLFVDKMLELLNHPSAKLQNASLLALGFAGPHADSKQQKLIQRKIAQFLTHSSLRVRSSAHAALTRFNPDDPRISDAVKKAQPSGSCKNTFKTPA